MLFRLIEQGTLPNHRKSHLKDCVVTAAVVGDISSERGMIRLESLSCAFPNNEVVDQSVEGTIFGSEGKNGVRGNPVWREGALLQRAFAAGALSGFSNALSQTYTANSISTLGNVQTVNGSKVAQYGLANGAGTAMDDSVECGYGGGCRFSKGFLSGWKKTGFRGARDT
jgi:conjugal transfer pilus assembly protein TraB